MGAKASTSTTSGNQSPRMRTFSTSSTGTDLVVSTSAPSSAGVDSGQGFSLLRALPELHTQQQNDRQRARSLSSVPDMQHHNQDSSQNTSSNLSFNERRSHNYSHALERIRIEPNRTDTASFNGQSVLLNSANTEGLINMEELENLTGVANSLSENSGRRVYSAISLPSHMWSLNGIKCPICSKFVLPDDIECHLVMCLTKPRLSYNEDVLNDGKGECVICLEELNAGDLIARLPCLCVYHKRCIDRWFSVNRSCPEHPGD